MKKEQIESAAFIKAELRSERLRILGVLSFVALFVCVTVLRVFVLRTVSKGIPWVWIFVLAAIVIDYEIWILYRVDRALRTSSSLAFKFRI